MKEARFETELDLAAAQSFADLSGDQNPIHVDAEYAAQTPFKRQVLHGAYSAGLISRLAGMYLPGKGCLLHAMKLRFVAPVQPPVRLVVSGRQVSGKAEQGVVEATVSDAASGNRYVEATYEFSLIETAAKPHSADITPPAVHKTTAEPRVLVTGASGGLGAALLQRLGKQGIGWSRKGEGGQLSASSANQLSQLLDGQKLSAIVHCAWPKPDNRSLLDIEGTEDVVRHHVSQPIAEVLELAKLLPRHGTDDAIIVLVGSTFAEPGRHAYRTPLYSLAKSTIPTLAKILAVEFGPTNRRSAAVVFDVLDGGMNSALSKAVKLTHADRMLTGALPNMAEAADQIAWVLTNRSRLISGATLTLSAGAIP
ncbi:MAG: SDR family oxidoreductase [Alphaproteobacteria bacterium]